MAASVSYAQAQQFGRDSVYAVPGKSAANRAGAPVVYHPGVQLSGRGSVYASQLKGPIAPVTSNVAGLQPFGRGSTYAMQPAQHGTPGSGTAVGTVNRDGTAGGGSAASAVNQRRHGG
jgi:hypothetical protein